MSDSHEDPQSDTRTPVTREVLYQQVWAEPMTTVAKEYGVSSSYLARVCTRLNVPRPAPGYWAKKAVGKAGKQPPLPEPRPGDELEWSRDGMPTVRVETQLKPPNAPLRRRRAKEPRPTEHRLVRGARELFLVGRETENGYLRPNKKLLLDLVVSRAALDRGLQIANDVYRIFEEFDYRVVLDPRQETLWRKAVDVRKTPSKRDSLITYWSPYGPTIVFVGTVAIGLTLYEIAEETEVVRVGGKYVPVGKVDARRNNALGFSWTITKDLPSGRFFLRVYSPYPNTSWTEQWVISSQQDVARLAARVARELPDHATVVARLAEDARRRAQEERRRLQEQWERWEREEKARKKAKAVKESKEELFSIMARWAEAQRISEFLTEVERKLETVSAEEKRVVQNRLDLAREMIGQIDALRDIRNWRTPQEREPD